MASMIEPGTIRKAVELLLAAIGPAGKVILFGSHARGQADAPGATAGLPSSVECG